jgi:hypothetical protein
VKKFIKFRVTKIGLCADPVMYGNMKTALHVKIYKIPLRFLQLNKEFLLLSYHPEIAYDTY